MEWRTMDSAPKDGTPILAWCEHDADEYFIKETGNLTDYGAAAEGMYHVEDGYNIIVWGGSYDDRAYHDPYAAYANDWWYRDDGEFETAANPIYWMPLPEVPRH